MLAMASPRTMSPDQDNLETINMNESRQLRHSKRLSLNFPVLVPSSTTTDQSARQTSSPTPHPSRSPMHTHNMSAPSTSVLSMPLTPPSESSEDGSMDHINSQLSPVSRQRVKSRHGRSHSTVPSRAHVKTTTPPDFLTLLASQERRVLELKEELARAEAELVELKKSWALHEAGKKKTEFRAGVVKMSPIASSTTTSPSTHNNVKSGGGTVGLGVDLNDNVDMEGRRRELAKERLMRRGHSEESNGSPGGKRTNQRVFSGSRHTRALSLLSTSALNSMNNQNGAIFHSAMPNSVNIMPNNAKSLLDSSKVLSSVEKDNSDPATTLPITAPLTRTNSGLSKDPLNFGKTYKELASAAAASRRQIPQGLAPDQIVKHGKIVVDGVRDGLWNFFEDIRQATVGEEATSETGAVQQPASKRNKSQTSQKNKTQESSGSFWREFGIDTPKGDKSQVRSDKDDASNVICAKHGHDGKHGNTRRVKSGQLKERTSSPPSQSQETTSNHGQDQDQDQNHSQKQQGRKSIVSGEGKLIEYEHESKSSTDSTNSRNPPSLLTDSSTQDDNDNGDEEDWEWGGFESPSSSRLRVGNNGGGDVAGIGGAGDGIKEVRWHELTS